MRASRAPEGGLLPLDDPRVIAATESCQYILEEGHRNAYSHVDPTDVAEVVNAVLKAEDELASIMTPEATEAASMWGVAQNPAFPLKDRLACALKALEFYGKGVLEG